eukprot:GEMP01102094.1.p1 GENE.GEMP01102094.1~~GEMP01102094.1.p1  ORF type:complete len:101 (+),score=5.44 GEMP01102094.1:441-743(+)
MTKNKHSFMNEIEHPPQVQFWLQMTKNIQVSEMEGGLAISALFLLQDKQKREFWGGKEVSGRKHCQKTCGEKEIRNASSLSEFIFSISIISIFNDSTFLF